MTTNQPKKKVIGNIGILDIRNATEESVASIGTIGNVGFILHSRETARLVTQLGTIGNLGFTIEAPKDYNFVMGDVEFTREYFANQKAPLHLLIVGDVRVRPEVEAKDIEEGIGGLIVGGSVECPEHLMGVVQSKLLHLSGSMEPYNEHSDEERVEEGHLTMDTTYLKSLKQGTRLVTMGNLTLPEVVDNELLRERVSALNAMGRILCHEENADTLLGLRDASGMAQVTIIPAGHHLVSKALRLDSHSLENLPSKKLYCRQQVVISANIERGALDEHLDSLICENVVICPASLIDAAHPKSPLDTTFAVYEGDLWLVEDEQKLLPSRFEFLEGKATLIVTGVLKVSPDVEPKVLADRLAKVHNLGVIKCTPEQVGAIQARLGISDGQIAASDPMTDDTEEKHDKPSAIGNIGYLAL